MRMDAKHTLYGAEDGRVYYLDEDGREMCVSAWPSLVQEICEVCFRYFREKQSDSAASDKFAPWIPQIVHSQQGVSFDLDKLTEWLFPIMNTSRISVTPVLELSTGALHMITEQERYQASVLEENVSATDITEPGVRVAVDLERTPDKYCILPPMSANKRWHLMRDFIATVPDASLRKELLRTITGGDAFRRFQDEILRHEKERGRWFSFRTTRERRAVLELLMDHGVTFREDISRQVG